MSSLNIEKLNIGDSQEELRNKINKNFDSIADNGGGPSGSRGTSGKIGPIGKRGIKGDSGVPGSRGTKWFISPLTPTGGLTDPIIVGDYWVQSGTTNNGIFEFTSVGWTPTGYDMQSNEVFEIINGISGPTGNKNGIVFNSPFPYLNTLVLSDSVPSTQTVNPNYAKLLISTNGTNDFPLIEFSKTDATNIGSPLDYTRHPQIKWVAPAGSSYGLLMNIPQDTFDLISSGDLSLLSTYSSVNITGNAGISLNSSAAMSISSIGSLSISSGSSVMTFNSQNFQISSSLFSIGIPMNITTTTTSNGLVIENTGDGSALLVSSSTASANYYLANFVSAGSSKFAVRNDGRISMYRVIKAFTSISGANDVTPPPYSVYATETIDWWRFGPTGANAITKGNTVYVDLSTSNSRGISIPLSSSSASWDKYLDEGQSISFRVMSSSTTKKIDDIGINGASGGNEYPANVSNEYYKFSPPALFVDATVVKINPGTGTGASKLYYSSCDGQSGILTLT